MSDRRLLLLGTLVSVTAAYVGIAVYAPIKVAIGRHSPALAALFSLPAFGHEYQDGQVLGFRVGMAKDQVFAQLRRDYAGRATVIGGCVVTTTSMIAVNEDTDIAALYGGGDQVCSTIGRGTAVTFRFQDNSLKTIRVSYAIIEGL